MHQKINTAVILAAGMGVRLKRLGEFLPKGFFCVTQTPIIVESIERLLDCGISRIFIVTGHQADFYQQLQRQFPDNIRLIHNPHYADSGSMYSLYLAKDEVKEEFLLLESDIIYEKRALTELLNAAKPDLVLCSSETGFDDAVFIGAENQHLNSMSKDRSEISGEVFGELVGICRISQPLFLAMQSWAEQAFEKTRHVSYETDCLVSVAREYPVICHRVTNLVWCEVDNEEHVETARATVYPKIKHHELSFAGRLLNHLKRLKKNLRRVRKSLRKPATMSGSNYGLARRMLLDVCELFNESNIRYMVDQGTLIGLKRDGDLLPWDDDVDVALPADQVEAVLKLIPVLQSRGWVIRKRYMHYPFHCWKAGDLQGLKVRRLKWGFLRSRMRMDINIKYKHEDSYYWHSMGVTCTIGAEHYDDVETLEWSGSTLKIPQHSEDYLEKKYGNWRTPDPDYVPRESDPTSIGRIASGKTLR